MLQEGGPRSGPRDAKVTLVVFLDYECQYSARHFPLLVSLRSAREPDLQIVVRQFPLKVHEHAKLAAEAALAAHAQGRYWQYAERLFQHNRELTETDLVAHAKAVGLALPRFRRELQKHSYAAAVEREIEIATRVGVPGVPLVYVNRRPVSNPLNEAALKSAIEQARATPSGP